MSLPAHQTINAAGRYRGPAMALHWIIAILIFGGYGLGLFMHDLPVSADKVRYYSWHKWAGVTVFLLALLRAAWRLSHPAPPLVTGRRWEHWVAHRTHFALYLLMLTIPLSGWLYSSAAGYQTVYLGLIPLPDLLSKNLPLSETLADVHEYLNYALLTLLILHAGAAFQHHFLRRDDVLKRMLPNSAVSTSVAMVTLLALVAFGVIGYLKVTDKDDDDDHHHHTSEAASTSESAPTAAAVAPVAAVATSGDIVAEFRQEHVPVQGHFTAFHALALQFDPAHVDQAHADIVVDTASFDIGDEDYSAEVRKKEWFDSAGYPQAHFVSDAVIPQADGHFQATGHLTIKDKTQPERVVFTVTQAAGNTVYAGELSVSRAAFDIGDKQWNDVVDDAVIVRFTVKVPVSAQ